MSTITTTSSTANSTTMPIMPVDPISQAVEPWYSQDWTHSMTVSIGIYCAISLAIFILLRCGQCLQWNMNLEFPNTYHAHDGRPSEDFTESDDEGVTQIWHEFAEQGIFISVADARRVRDRFGVGARPIQRAALERELANQRVVVAQLQAHGMLP